MRSEDASTLTHNEPTRFVWMMGCVLQDACDNMPDILIFKLKLLSRPLWRRRIEQVNWPFRTYAGLEVEQRWR